MTGVAATLFALLGAFMGGIALGLTLADPPARGHRPRGDISRVGPPPANMRAPRGPFNPPRQFDPPRPPYTGPERRHPHA